MMSMLRAGGLSLLSDDRRQADQDNPFGYFEFESVKQLPQDHSWLPMAKGKAVKIQAYLLPFLPSGYEYRIVFMLRDLDEIVASQERMLGHLHPDRPSPTEGIVDLMARHLQETLDLLSSRESICSVHVFYPRLVQKPLGDAHRINAFFAGQLDVSAMLSVIDPELHRQRGRLPPWSAGASPKGG